MLLVDVLAVLILVVALVLGAARGLLASLGTIVGLVVGALAVYWLVPIAGGWVPDAAWRPLVLVGGAIAVVVGCAAAGSALGGALRRGAGRIRLRGLDRVLGAVFGLVAAALGLVLVAATITATGAPVIAAAVASSRVLDVVDRLTPTPVDEALAQLRAAVVDEGLPRFGELLEPEQTPSLPPVALDDPGLEAAAASVARISGVAAQCGMAQTGSGFVVASGLVATNAHVVAGVTAPVVELPGREAREGRVVYFDPSDDLALIAAPDLSGKPLPIVDPVSVGASVAVLGYPLGGPLVSSTAHVVSVGEVQTEDIYGAPGAQREIYSMQAVVRPGNSGGPVLTSDGEVVGVVFARGETDSERGYALTTTELRAALQAASTDAAAVSTGACIVR